LGNAAMAADSSIPAHRIGDLIPAYGNESPPARYRSEITPVYDWTGPFAGINLGGEVGKSVWDHVSPVGPTTNISLSGGAVGASFGYNFQFGRWVAGVDSDIDWMNARGSTPCRPLGICETRGYWLGTTRGRVGYAFDRIFPYATAGLAFGQIFADGTTPPFSVISTKFGFAAGAGIEYAIYGPWTGKAEYLYVSLSKLTVRCAAQPDHLAWAAQPAFSKDEARNPNLVPQEVAQSRGLWDVTS
jgi:outer membrane immunogenic protein